MNIARRTLIAGTAIGALALAAPSFAADPARKTEIDAGADGALETLYAQNPGARELAKKAVALLIFPKIVKAGLVVGGQTGDGVLRIAGEPVAYYNTSAASIGFQAGVQSYSQVLMFLEHSALEKFRASKGWEAGVDGSITLLKTGVSAGIDTSTIKDPIVAFVFGEKGLMADASIAGSKYTKLDL